MVNFSIQKLPHFASSTQTDPFHPLIASSKLKPDMVLEDVDSDNEDQEQKSEALSTAATPSTSLAPPSPAPDEPQPLSHSLLMVSMQSTQDCSFASPASEPLEGLTKISQEDAETQTGRWTPFIESIKKEAEDIALATMEER